MDVYSNQESEFMLSRQRNAMDSYPSQPVQTNFSLETTVINGVEYATVDQVRQMGKAATKQGAKQGERQVYSSLRNSRSRRSRLGM